MKAVTVAVLTSLLWAGSLLAQDDKAELEKLKKRVDELEKKQAEKAPAAQPSEAVKWNEIIVGPSKIKFYGFIRLDVIYDDSRVDIGVGGGANATNGLIGFVLAEDADHPVAAQRAETDDDTLFIHPRLSRLGMDFDGPKIELLENAKVTGKLEIDFYNGGSESRDIPRMRHAYLKLAWDNWSFLAGQTSDLISPLWTIVNSDMVMWGAGNLADRRPQVRIDVWFDVGSGRLFLQSMAGLTSAVDGNASGAFGDLAGPVSGLPTVQNRIAYRFPLWEKQFVEIGAWIHHAWEKVDVRVGGNNFFHSQAWGVDVTLPVYEDIVWFKGELWEGENLDDVRGGIFQGINARGHEISSTGGFAEVGIKLAAWLVVSFGYATDNPSNAEISANGREENQIFYFAVRVMANPVEIGLDYMNWRTLWDNAANGDSDEGTDNRVVIYFAFKF